MTIQRHYDLPNCRLIVEGWSSDPADGTARPVLSMITNAECHVAGHPQPLVGGREFVQALAQVVSTYAQGILSNIPRDSASEGVRLDRLGLNRHRLVVQPDKTAIESGIVDSAEVQQLDLTTVQLFDLVEAVDQLVADAQTLPDLVLPLSSVSRRSVAPQEPLSRRVVPAALGVSGLAAAAIALFFVAPPEFRPTELERDPVTEEVEEGADSSSAGDDPNAEDFEALDPEDTDPVEASPDEVDSERGGPVDSSIEPNQLAASPDAPNNATAARDRLSRDEIDEEAIDELFTNAVPLSDPDQIDALVPKLRRSISRSWDGGDGVDELIYRVGTNSDGEIIGFKYVNDAALEQIDQTPLLQLTQLPQGDGLPLAPIGQFRVVLRSNGVVEVSPWYGRPLEPDADSDTDSTGAE